MRPPSDALAGSKLSCCQFDGKRQTLIHDTCTRPTVSWWNGDNSANEGCRAVNLLESRGPMLARSAYRVGDFNQAGQCYRNIPPLDQ